MFLLANKWRINRLRKLLYPGLEISPSIIQEFVNYSPLCCHPPPVEVYVQGREGLPADKLEMIKIICFRKIIWKQTLPWQDDMHIWLVMIFNIPGARVLRMEQRTGDLDEVNEDLWDNNDFRCVCLIIWVIVHPHWCLQHRGIYMCIRAGTRTHFVIMFCIFSEKKSCHISCFCSKL